MTNPVFEPFPKIPRLNRTISITEKIDGTNAQVVVTEDGLVLAGSRTRWITPDNDNAGFAKWVAANEEALRTGLGIGTHYGEWWGAGIGRGYGLSQLRTDQNGKTHQLGKVGEKRFSLFNAHRWTDDVRPIICSVVPTLYVGAFSQAAIFDVLDCLRKNGSIAQPGYMKPEGVVIYMHASGTMHKVLLEGDDLPKGLLTLAERERSEPAEVFN